MSLYHESAEVLKRAHNGGGSLKSIVFGQKTWKSDPKTLFALSAETAKWSEVLSDVLDKSGILKLEKQLSPLLALALVHDLLLSKRGIALPQNHGIHTTISRHKARLTAELTKARLRRGFASLDDLRAAVNLNGANTDAGQGRYPRWIRVNTLKTSLDEQLCSTFAEYERAKHLGTVTTSSQGTKAIWVDEHVPDLVAISPQIDITATKAYKEGEIILQDKASCFPAVLLDPTASDGEIVDACAAPGNKTTHLAALRSRASNDSSHCDETRSGGSILACEKDATRAQTLARMVKVAGAEKLVRIREKQDFLRLDPAKFQDVTALLLDPSCSGSGIVGRDESTITIHLPGTEPEMVAQKGKKRKRGAAITTSASSKPTPIKTSEANPTAEQESTVVETDATKLKERLAALSAFQLRIVLHAMAFPTASRITYSTCSVHDEENESVVVRALLSDVARERGWQILPRIAQVNGMQTWPRRGRTEAVLEAFQKNTKDTAESAGFNADVIANACIRCHKDSEDLTMGFFVAGFIRPTDGSTSQPAEKTNGSQRHVESADEEWNGFSDEED